MASEHHGKNNGGLNLWIVRVKVTPQLLNINLSLFDKSSRGLAGDVKPALGQLTPQPGVMIVTHK